MHLDTTILLAIALALQHTGNINIGILTLGCLKLSHDFPSTESVGLKEKRDCAAKVVIQSVEVTPLTHSLQLRPGSLVTMLTALVAVMRRHLLVSILLHTIRKRLVTTIIDLMMASWLNNLPLT